MKQLEVLIYEEQLKERNALAWCHTRMQWHTMAIKYLKTEEEEQFFILVQ